MEKERGLPVSPYMNRADTSQAKMSLNFIDYVVSPLFNNMVKAFDELTELSTNLQSNKDAWARLKNEEEAKKLLANFSQ